MLTIEQSALSTDLPNHVFALEFDMEHADVQVRGPADVNYRPGDHGGPTLASCTTGGCYGHPFLIPAEEPAVELWNAEDHYLAVFPDELSLREGASVVASAWGDAMPVGIHRALTSP